ncbi:MAG TPA: hypothetical protein VIN59_09850 [Alphaproteobacteria bacterium]
MGRQSGPRRQAVRHLSFLKIAFTAAAIGLSTPALAHDASLTLGDFLKTNFPILAQNADVMANTDHIRVHTTPPTFDETVIPMAFGDVGYPVGFKGSTTCDIYSFTTPDNVMPAFNQIVNFPYTAKVDAVALASFVIEHEIIHCKKGHKGEEGALRMVNETEADLLAIEENKKIFPDAHMDQIIPAMRALYPQYPTTTILTRSLQGAPLPSISDIGVAFASRDTIQTRADREMSDVMPNVLKVGLKPNDTTVDDVVIGNIIALYRVRATPEFKGTEPAAMAQTYLDVFEFMRSDLFAKATQIYIWDKQSKANNVKVALSPY